MLTTFQITALAATAVWLVAVLVWFRRSPVVLIGGLFALGIDVLVWVLAGGITPGDVGLVWPESWPLTLLSTGVGLAVAIAYSPVADWLATRWAGRPPDLSAFRAVQHSPVKLAAGVVAVWVLGGFLEELVARGIVLNAVRSLLAAWLPDPLAVGVAVGVAAAGAGLMHLYQGRRAVLIVTQLSVLFGVLFVVTGYNLWAVVLCHGLYDTVALIRFAAGKSKYSRPDPPA